MSRRAPWLAGLGLAAALGLGLWAEQADRDLEPPSPVPAADNPGPRGLEAAYLYLASQRKAKILDQSMSPMPVDAATLVTALPYRREVKEAEREALLRWVEDGGTLVVLGEHGYGLGGAVGSLLSPTPVALDIRGREVGLGEMGSDLRAILHAASRPQAEDVVPARPARADPLTAGAQWLAVSPDRGFDAPAGSAQPLLLAGDTPIALTLAHGKGRIVAFAGPDAFTNERLDLADNLQLLANLSRDGVVYFDELHHQAPPVGAMSDLGRWVGPALLQWLAIGLVLALSASPRLGPIHAAHDVPLRTTRAYAERLGRLYRRARAEGALCDDLYQALRRRLHERMAIASSLEDERVRERLAARDAELGRRYLALARALRAAKGGTSPERYADLMREAVRFERAL